MTPYICRQRTRRQKNAGNEGTNLGCFADLHKFFFVSPYRGTRGSQDAASKGRSQPNATIVHVVEPSTKDPTKTKFEYRTILEPAVEAHWTPFTRCCLSTF